MPPTASSVSTSAPALRQCRVDFAPQRVSSDSKPWTRNAFHGKPQEHVPRMAQEQSIRPPHDGVLFQKVHGNPAHLRSNDSWYRYVSAGTDESICIGVLHDMTASPTPPRVARARRHNDLG